MTADLGTTNLFLGIVAVASLLELVGVLGVCLGLFIVSRRIVQLINTIDKDQLAPAAARVQAILDDVKDVTSNVREQTTRVSSLARWIAGLLRRPGHDHVST